MCGEFLQRTRGNLILYPEGTRSRDGEIQTFKKGAGLFAVELRVPVVPAHIDGAHEILAKGRFVPRPRTVTVRFGEPIMFASNQFGPRCGPRPRRAAVELLEQRIRGLRWTSPDGEVIRLAQEPEEEDQTTISISAATQGGRHTQSQGHG
jgi:1-acyl-sn-glycerol-3-phosphate acyltransferase